MNIRFVFLKENDHDENVADSTASMNESLNDAEGMLRCLVNRGLDGLRHNCGKIEFKTTVRYM